MRRARWLLGLVGVGAVACSQQLSRTEISVETQVVADRFAGWARAFNNRDVDSLAAFYHQTPDLSVASMAGDRIRGWDDFAPVVRSRLRNIARMNLGTTDTDIQILAANVALLTCRYSADVILMTTDRDIYSGQLTMVWVKDDADHTWKIHAEHFSRAPDQGP